MKCNARANCRSGRVRDKVQSSKRCIRAAQFNLKMVWLARIKTALIRSCAP